MKIYVMKINGKKLFRFKMVLSLFLMLGAVSCFKNDRYVAPVPTVDKCSGQAGPLFIAARLVITQNCIRCHNNSIMNGGMNWTVDCNIVTFSARIKTRAIVEGSMPPGGALSQADKDKLNAWLNAGALISN